MTLRRILIVILVLLAAYVFWTWDGSPPTISWGELQTAYGRNAAIDVTVADSGGGLKKVRAEIRQGGESHEVFSEEYRSLGWFERSGTSERSVAISLRDADLKAGDFELLVEAWDQPTLGFWTRHAQANRTFVFDPLPPIVQVLSKTHVIRQGGSEVVIYKTDEELASSGVRVGERFFPGFPIGDGQIALFALAYDAPVSSTFSVVATDVAGNETEVPLSIEVLPGHFRSRRIDVTDDFIKRVAAEILPRANEIEEGHDLLETFLNINSRLRKINHAFIADLCKKTAPNPLWHEPFLQLSRSKAEANFADHRTYYYKSREIDQETHQGYDLASVARSPVEAANSGRVLYADYLGIYGNCILLDHGLGLVSLYGHMSAILVSQGQTVERGESMGQTGETGLAGGDHLHFSTIVHGVQVTPLEWWDPDWVKIHFQDRLALLTGEGSNPKSEARNSR